MNRSGKHKVVFPSGDVRFYARRDKARKACSRVRGAMREWLPKEGKA